MRFNGPELVVRAGEDQHPWRASPGRDQPGRRKRAGILISVEEDDVWADLGDEPDGLLAVRCDAYDLEPWVVLQLRMKSFREEAVMVVVHEQDAHGVIGGGSRHRWLSIADLARPCEARFR